MKKVKKVTKKKQTPDKHLAEFYEREFADPSAKRAPNFYERVYAIVEQIPRGKVTTYGAIAEVLGSKGSARMVGQALTARPEERDFPAQRVINRFGALTGSIHFGGYERMRGKLVREEVTFKGELVDMEKHFWYPRSITNHE